MAVKINGVEVIDDSRNITSNVGTVDGRDVAADGTKLDGIESGADVTADNLGSALTGLDTITSVEGSDIVAVYDATATAWKKATITNAALAGDKGQKGEVGSKGQKGDTGAGGAKGQKGEKGQKGDTGATGDKGQKGETGAKGQKGEVGQKGEKGEVGQKGEKGQKGNPTGFPWQFDSSTLSGNPGVGKFRFDRLPGPFIEEIFLSRTTYDEFQNGGDVVEELIESWDNATGTSKGILTMKSYRSNGVPFVICEINTITNLSSHYRLDVTGIEASNSDFTNGEVVYFEFSQTGDKGQKGEVGQKGQKGELADGMAITVYDNTGGQDVTSGAVLNLDTTAHTTSTQTFVLSNDVLTINASDLFTFHLEVTTDILSGSSRSVSKAYLQEYNGSTWSTVDGTTVYMYNRISGNGEATGAATFTRSVTSGYGYRIYVVRHTGSDTIRTVADASRLTVVGVSGGTQGPQGTGSVAGPAGATGAKGQKGEIGETGSKGQKGEIGATGDKGQKGEIGGTGAKGQKGEVGTDGTDGAKGQKGEAGVNGTDGTNGADGATGPKGQKGEIGATGPKGQKGEIGGTGAKGQKGEIGGTGAKGQKGDTGGTGAKGQKGEVGQKGQTGATGAKGQKGEAGVDGINGTDGVTGPKGQKGEAGTDGTDGAGGAKGQKGQKGEVGSKGQKGEEPSSVSSFTVAGYLLYNGGNPGEFWIRDDVSGQTPRYRITQTDGHYWYSSDGTYIMALREAPVGLILQNCNLSLTGTSGVRSSLKPETADTYDLGVTGTEWESLYLSQTLDFTTSSSADSSGRGRIKFKDGDLTKQHIRFGTSIDSHIYYDGTNDRLTFENNGDATRSFAFKSSASDIDMLLDGSGNLAVEGNVTAYSTSISSDIKLKEDLCKIEDALDMLSNINGYYYTLKRDGTRNIGLIAQEVEKVAPEIVLEHEELNSDETYKSVQYNQVIPILVEAVKQLKVEVEELKNGSSN